MSFRVEEAKNNFYKIVVIKDFGNCKIFPFPLLQIFLKTLLSTKIFSFSQHLPRHNPLPISLVPTCTKLFLLIATLYSRNSKLSSLKFRNHYLYCVCFQVKQFPASYNFLKPATICSQLFVFLQTALPISVPLNGSIPR
jgi:hypothetical protein